MELMRFRGGTKAADSDVPVAPPQGGAQEHAVPDAGNGDVAGDAIDSSESSEKIEGFLRKCGNVIFTKTHEIIEGWGKIQRRNYQKGGRCPGVFPEVWERLNPDEKAELWKEWKEKYGEPPAPPPTKKSKAAGGGNVAAVASPTRTIVEFCCGENSRMGRTALKKPDCKVVRLTMKDDLRTPSGRETAIKAVTENPQVLLWVAIPCTGGCPWQRYNAKRSAETAGKIEEHRIEMRKLWKTLEVVANVNRKNGGKIAIEWPSNCDYWRLDFVNDFMVKYHLIKAKCQGCAFGLCDDHKQPIMKPWTIATDDPVLVRTLEAYKCPGKLVHPHHAPCQGKYTKRTEGYTDTMVKAVHRAWQQSCERAGRAETCAAYPTVTESQEKRPAMMAPVVQPTNLKRHKQRCSPGVPAETAPNNVPRMPLREAERQHRQKVGNPWPMFSAMVAKQLSRKEYENNPEAMNAMTDEVRGLEKLGVWNLATVRSRKDVEREARISKTKKIHVARIFGICVLKGSELPVGHKLRKYKGRYVFQGNQVTDENREVALFNELSSSPATLEGAKAVDVFGLQVGYVIQQADARKAYTQADMVDYVPLNEAREGTMPAETWVVLPPEARPKEWEKLPYKDPVVRLDKALYGHPDAGGAWETHCDKKLQEIGFKPVPNWPSVYYHREWDLLLMVYVDDFKMSGPQKNIEKGWKAIREKLDLDEPGPVDHCLGCKHNVGSATINGKTVRVMEYDVCDFMRQCVTAYKELAGDPAMKLRKVQTPFLPSSDGRGDASEELGESSDDNKGALGGIASSVLMKILYGARAARWDLLKAVQLLATRVTKWTLECDKALHRLICYIDSTSDFVLRGYVGDDAAAWRLRLFADADFAGERPGYKSTSGSFLIMSGPSTYFPLSAKSAKQTSVSHSTPEAEIVSAALGIRTVGVPALDLWEFVLQRLVILELMEDNQSTIQVIKTGKNPTMRHISRTHGVNVSWLHDCYARGIFTMTYQTTDGQSADIFTKVFRDSVKWDHARKLIGVGNATVSRVEKNAGAGGAAAEDRDGDVQAPRRHPRIIRVKRNARQELPLPPKISHLWSRVWRRTTYDLKTGDILSRQVIERGKPSGFYRRAFTDGPKDVKVVFDLDKNVVQQQTESSASTSNPGRRVSFAPSSSAN